MEYKETTNKLGSSRILKFSLLSIGVLFFIKLISLIIITWILKRLELGKFSESFDLVIRIVEVLDVSVVGSIATVAAAVIARYGLREATGNIAERDKVVGGEISGAIK